MAKRPAGGPLRAFADQCFVAQRVTSKKEPEGPAMQHATDLDFIALPPRLMT